MDGTLDQPVTLPSTPKIIVGLLLMTQCTDFSREKAVGFLFMLHLNDLGFQLIFQEAMLFHFALLFKSFALNFSCQLCSSSIIA